MSFLTYVRTALLAISRNRLRSLLTTISILIGVAAVISMLAIGNGSQEKIQDIINNLGTTAMYIIPGRVTKGGLTTYANISDLTVQDADSIKRNCPDVSGVSPEVQSVELVIFQSANWTTEVDGVGSDWFSIGNFPLAEGRALDEEDIHSQARVCLVGATVVENLFGDQDPLGQTIRIKHTPFRVVGVLERKGDIFGQDQDDIVYVPYTTDMHRITGVNRLYIIEASAPDMSVLTQATQEVQNLLHARHHIAPWEDDDFFIRTPEEFMATLNETAEVVELLLAAAAGISLFVGGIGIMNTMLSSVVERTREIGIRMAVGATESDILAQFLIEALVLSLFGGSIGIILGVAVAFLVDKGMEVPFQFPIDAILIASTFSALVGIFFGYYPARKASRLNPIEALRSL